VSENPQFKVWCPNCLRGLYVWKTLSSEFRKTKCHHCTVPFEYDRYGQVKRIEKVTEHG
jgi:hypothetical protein